MRRRWRLRNRSCPTILSMRVCSGVCRAGRAQRSADELAERPLLKRRNGCRAVEGSALSHTFGGLRPRKEDLTYSVRSRSAAGRGAGSSSRSSIDTSFSVRRPVRMTNTISLAMPVIKRRTANLIVRGSNRKAPTTPKKPSRRLISDFWASSCPRSRSMVVSFHMMRVREDIEPPSSVQRRDSTFWQRSRRIADSSRFPGRELTAGGINILSAASAYRHRDAVANHHLDERVQAFVSGAAKAETHYGVVHDQVNLTGCVGSKPGEQVGILKRVVDAVEHAVFVCHTAPGDADVVLNGRLERCQIGGGASVHRHDRRPLFITRRVK